MIKRCFIYLFLLLVLMVNCGCSNSASTTTTSNGIDNDAYDYVDESNYDDSELQESYENGWNDAADEVFSNSPNGYFYYDGEEYSPDDYWGYAGDYSDAVDPDEAYSEGYNDAVNEIFDSTPEGILCYGEDVYSAGDFSY